MGALVLLCSTAPARAASATVGMDDDSFARAYVRILVGDGITWSNTGEGVHTVTAYADAPRPFDSHPEYDPARGCDDGNFLTEEDCLDPGETFSVTFEETGTYKFFCKVHGDPSVDPDQRVSAAEQPCGMCGQISVVAKDPNPRPTKTATPRTPATKRAGPTKTPKAKVTVSPSASATTGSVPVAAGGSGSGGGGGGRLTLALLSIVALGGAGYYTWRRFLSGPTAV